MRYRFLDKITSDVMFEAYGKNLEELFENAAYAMFSVISDIKRISLIKKIKIEVSSDSYEGLLTKWLSELLVQSEIKEMFFANFNVKINKKKPSSQFYNLMGYAEGEPYSVEKSGTLVKGITYYGLEIKKTKSGYKARIALDI